MPLGGKNGGGKAAPKSTAAKVAEETADDLSNPDFDLSDVDIPDFGVDLTELEVPETTPVRGKTTGKAANGGSSKGGKRNAPAPPDLDDELPDPPELGPEEDLFVPGEEDLTESDLGIPGSTDSVLAEYLPGISSKLDGLVAQLGDYHKSVTQRAESQLQTTKSLFDGFCSKIDCLESEVHELKLQFRTLIRSLGKGAAAEGEPEAVEDVSPEQKAPPKPALPTLEAGLAAVGTKHRLLAFVQKVQSWPDDKEVTVQQFENWVVKNGGGTPDQVKKLLNVFKVKQPITNKSFPSE